MRHAEEWLEPFDGPFDAGAVVHLLRRTALGHPPDLIRRCLDRGRDEAVRLLIAGEPPDAREERLLQMRDVLLAREDGDALAAWWWARLLMTRHPLQARMSVFWHDHFATSIEKVKSPYWMAQQLSVFDAHGLGDFRALLIAIAKTPAMLRWLDNDRNRKGQANENFARELFELFTLGRDKYSERDIKEAARAFTGWRIAREQFFFDRRRHDRGEKEIFGKRGRFSGEQVIDLALRRDDCARFVGDKLLRAFVGPNYPEEVLPVFAKRLRAERGHIGRVLQVLLCSRLFYRAESRNARIRGPVEWIVWFLRTLECTASPERIARAAGTMGQALLAPPDVSGWDEEKAWISSTTWLQRANFAGRIGRAEDDLSLRPQLMERVSSRRPDGEVRWLIERLFPAGLAKEHAGALEAQARAESKLDRDVRLAGLLRAALMLPQAHRF